MKVRVIIKLLKKENPDVDVVVDMGDGLPMHLENFKSPRKMKDVKDGILTPTFDLEEHYMFNDQKDTWDEEAGHRLAPELFEESH